HEIHLSFLTDRFAKLSLPHSDSVFSMTFPFSRFCIKYVALIQAAIGIMSAIPIPAQKIVKISALNTLEFTISPSVYFKSMYQNNNHMIQSKVISMKC